MGIFRLRGEPAQWVAFAVLASPLLLAPVLTRASTAAAVLVGSYYQPESPTPTPGVDDRIIELRAGR